MDNSREVPSKSEVENPTEDTTVALTTDKAIAIIDPETERAVNDLIWSEWRNVGQMNYTKYPPVRHVSQLEFGKKYPIKGFHRVNDTSNLIIMESDDFSIFLPKRLCDLPIPRDFTSRYFVVRRMVPCKNDKERFTPLLDFVL